MKNIFLTLIGIIFIFNAFSKTTTSVADGNWNVAGTWDNGKPSWGDIVIINHNVAYNVTFDIGDGSVTINATGSLIKTGTQSLNMWSTAGALINYGTLDVQNLNGTGTYENYNSWTCNNFNIWNAAGSFTNNGTVNMNDFSCDPEPTIVNNGTFNLDVYDGSGIVTNNGTVNLRQINNVYGNGQWTNTSGSVLTASNFIRVYNSAKPFVNAGTITVANTGDSEFEVSLLDNSGTMTFNANSVNLYGDVSNTGTINAYDFYAEYSTINNFSTINISNNLASLNHSTEFVAKNGSQCNISNRLQIYNSSIVTVEDGGEMSIGGHIWHYGANFVNNGRVLNSGAGTLSGDEGPIINNNYMELNIVDVSILVENNDTLIIKDEVNNYYTNAVFHNTNNAYCYVENYFLMWAKEFENDGLIHVNGDMMTGGGVTKFENRGIIICEGEYDNGCNVLNNGAIYAFGGFLHDDGGTNITSTTCGHINTGCNQYRNDWGCTTTGNLNIQSANVRDIPAENSNPPGIAGTITYNPWCPCDLGLEYYSRDNGNWDEYELCSGGKSVWTLKQIQPDPVYEYPKVYGKATVLTGHTIEIDPTCDQPLECDSVALRSKGNLTIDNSKALTVNGDFIINSPQNTEATGSLLDYENLTVTGTQTVQRYITKHNWHYFGSPVDVFDGSTYFQPNFYYYDETQNDTWSGDNIYGTMGWTSPGTGVLNTDMRGYIYYYENDMLEFTGNLNTANKSYTLSYTNNNPSNPEFDGWNLIANPYPSAIDWDAVTTTGIIDNCVYFYDDDGSSPYFNNYKYYIKGGGGSSPYPSISVNGGQQYVPVAQAFFVRTTNNGQAFNLDNSTRVHSSQDFYKNCNEKEYHPDLLRLQVANDVANDETIIRFIPDATETHDSEFDAIKYFSYSGDLPQIYSLTKIEGDLKNPQNLAVNTLPSYFGKRSVDLGFKTNTEGEFTISATELNFENNQIVYLIDHYEETKTDLQIFPNYNFSSEAGNFTDRFEIHFYEQETEIAEEQDLLSVYSHENQITINQLADLGDVNIKIISANGQVLIDQNSNQSRTTFTVNTTGVYIVRVKTENDIFVKKVVVL